MKNNLIVTILILLSLAACAFGYPKAGEIPAPPGGAFVWEDTSKTWVPMAGSSNGGMSTTPAAEVFVAYTASITLSVSTDTARICPNLGTATKILVWASGDCNFGAADISSGTTGIYVPGDAPLFPLSFSTSSPILYFRMRDSSGTVRIYKAN